MYISELGLPLSRGLCVIRNKLYAVESCARFSSLKLRNMQEAEALNAVNEGEG